MIPRALFKRQSYITFTNIDPRLIDLISTSTQEEDVYIS